MSISRNFDYFTIYFVDGWLTLTSLWKWQYHISFVCLVFYNLYHFIIYFFGISSNKPAKRKVKVNSFISMFVWSVVRLSVFITKTFKIFVTRSRNNIQISNKVWCSFSQISFLWGVKFNFISKILKFLHRFCFFFLFFFWFWFNYHETLQTW